MIRLINANHHDMRAYYNETVLMLANEDGSYTPVMVECVNSRTELTVRPYSKSARLVSRDQLRVHYFEPFYNDDGSLIGTPIARNYKRAPWYEMKDLKVLDKILKNEYTSTFDGNYGRIGTQFFVTPWQTGTGVVQYLGEMVGLCIDQVFWIPDLCIVERLREIIYKEGMNYDVVPAPALS